MGLASIRALVDLQSLFLSGTGVSDAGLRYLKPLTGLKEIHLDSTAITDKGLIIDAVNHVGEMLERTKEDVGSTVTIFDRAEVYNFCSAALSRKVMEADPMNLQFCPYGIFVMQKPGEEGATTIGYRIMPEGPMKEVQALLEDIVQEAISE